MLDVHDVVVVVVIVVAGIAVALHVDGIVFFVLLLKDVHLPMSAKRNDHPKMHPNFHLSPDQCNHSTITSTCCCYSYCVSIQLGHE